MTCQRSAASPPKPSLPAAARATLRHHRQRRHIILPDAMSASREALELEMLRRELSAVEEHAYATALVSLTASFSLAGGRRLGVHLNDWNVILRIDEGLLAHEEGTLRVGDKLIAVNEMSADGVPVKDLIRGLDRVMFVYASICTTMALNTASGFACATLPNARPNSLTFSLLNRRMIFLASDVATARAAANAGRNGGLLRPGTP